MEGLVKCWQIGSACGCMTTSRTSWVVGIVGHTNLYFVWMSHGVPEGSADHLSPPPRPARPRSLWRRSGPLLMDPEFRFTSEEATRPAGQRGQGGRARREGEELGEHRDWILSLHSTHIIAHGSTHTRFILFLCNFIFIMESPTINLKSLTVVSTSGSSGII